MRSLVLKAAVGVLALLAFAALTGLLLREPITVAATWLYAHLGLAGIFLGVLIADSSPIPMTHEPVTFLAVSAGESFWRLLVTSGTASVLAGPTGWTGGRLARSNQRFCDWMQRRFPKLVDLMERHGAKGLAIAALLPVPFAIATWLAGMTAVRFGPLCAASLLRFPKTAFYLWLLYLGWNASS